MQTADAADDVLCPVVLDCRNVLEVPRMNALGCAVWVEPRRDALADAMAACDEAEPDTECLWAECVVGSVGGFWSDPAEGEP